MADSTLAALTAATAATGGLFYGTQSAADRKFTLTAAGATLAEAADAAAQRTALAVLPLAGGTLTGQLIQSTNGAASTPPLLLSGTIFTGGSSSTTKPSLLVEPSGATSNNWSTNGTLLGLNAPSGFTGPLFDAQLNGSSVLRLIRTTSNGVSNMATLESSSASTPQILFNEPHSGVVMRRKDAGWSGMFYAPGLAMASNMKLGFVPNDSVSSLGSSHDAYFVRSAAASIQMGANHATTATDQTFKAHDVTTGTGAALTLAAGSGTGTLGASVVIEGGGSNFIKLKPDGTNVMLTAASNSIELAEGIDFSIGNTTGTIIATATTQKLAFWGTTPVVQPAHIADPTGSAGVGSDTVDLNVLNTTLSDLQSAVASINAMLAATGLTAAS